MAISEEYVFDFHIPALICAIGSGNVGNRRAAERLREHKLTLSLHQSPRTVSTSRRSEDHRTHLIIRGLHKTGYNSWITLWCSFLEETNLVTATLIVSIFEASEDERQLTQSRSMNALNCRLQYWCSNPNLDRMTLGNPYRRVRCQHSNRLRNDLHNRRATAH